MAIQNILLNIMYVQTYTEYLLYSHRTVMMMVEMKNKKKEEKKKEYSRRMFLLHLHLYG